MFYKVRRLNTKMVKMLFIIVNFLLFSISMINLYGVSYNILSVTPLFFLNFPSLFFAISFGIITLTLFSLTIKYDKVLFTIVTLLIYYVVLYLPSLLLNFTIYNDQLGFAVEVLYGYVNGYVTPYQGEHTTLGHAYFTTVFGKLLGLDLYGVVKYEEAVFVFMPFLIYLSTAIKLINKHVANGNANIMAIAILLTFPSLALEPLMYSRGYFGLILGIMLFAYTFTFIEKRRVSDSIILTIIFMSSSISYPLQPLILVFSMIMLIFISWFLSLIEKDMVYAYSKLKLLIPKALCFFVIWSCIHVFYGQGVWKVLSEVILKTLRQEFFTALEQLALKYVGDALIYTNLRIVMMASTWTISVFIALVLIFRMLKLKVVHPTEYFAFSVLAVLLSLGTMYGAAYHEPATRFYRTLVAIMPFVLLNVEGLFIGKGVIGGNALKKVLMALLLLILSIFLFLSPITKWGWTFIGYPTAQDIELADYIAFHRPLSYDYFYAPGSHQLLDFMFKINAFSVNEIRKEAIKSEDIEFNLNEASFSKYVATFYRIYILSRWAGKDIEKMLLEIHDFSSSNNLVYNSGGLHLLIENCKVLRQS